MQLREFAWDHSIKAKMMEVFATHESYRRPLAPLKIDPMSMEVRLLQALRPQDREGQHDLARRTVSCVGGALP